MNSASSICDFGQLCRFSLLNHLFGGSSSDGYVGVMDRAASSHLIQYSRSQELGEQQIGNDI